MSRCRILQPMAAGPSGKAKPPYGAGCGAPTRRKPRRVGQPRSWWRKKRRAPKNYLPWKLRRVELLETPSGYVPHVKLGFLRLIHQHWSPLSVGIVAEAAPCPLLRFEHQAAYNGNAVHVTQFFDPLFFR